MILFTILFFIVSLLLISGIIVVSVGGAGFILLFGDIIVCVALIVWLYKMYKGRKK